MEKVLERRDMQAALRRVEKNRGSPGEDEMKVEELLPYLRERWEETKSSLLDGRYQPSPINGQETPKSGGGTRKLGIPTVLDRLIQQALLEVLQPQFDPTFSEHSRGFRPGRSAHGAIREAQRYVQEGSRIAVDVDLESFFDSVNHDVLMGMLAERFADRRLRALKLKQWRRGRTIFRRATCSRRLGDRRRTGRRQRPPLVAERLPAGPSRPSQLPLRRPGPAQARDVTSTPRTAVVRPRMPRGVGGDPAG